jgi:tRNA pseudouridine13 synthase
LSGLPLNGVVAGDFVVNVERSSLPMVHTGKIVDETKLSDVNEQIQAGKIRLALPIVGFGQRLSMGEVGEMQHRVLDKEGVEPQNFRVDVLPEVRCRGELRAAVAPVRNFSFDMVSPDEENPGAQKVQLQFFLLRSSYATVLLREVMKPRDLIAAGF